MLDVMLGKLEKLKKELLHEDMDFYSNLSYFSDRIDHIIKICKNKMLLDYDYMIHFDTDEDKYVVVSAENEDTAFLCMKEIEKLSGKDFKDFKLTHIKDLPKSCFMFIYRDMEKR